MSTDMDRSRFVRTRVIFNEIGFTPNNENFKLAMQIYHVPHRQYGGIDHYDKLECIKAMHEYHTMVSDKFMKIHSERKGDVRYERLANTHKLYAKYSKEAYDRLTGNG